MTINEMRTKRAKAWDAAKAFLDSHTNENGMLSPEDDAVYTKMENEIADYSKEIARLERREALDAELNMPTSKRITEKPNAPKSENEKTGIASDTYKKAFWNQLRSKLGVSTPELRNSLQEGTDSEGGFLVPDEFEHTLVTAMNNATIIDTMVNDALTDAFNHYHMMITAENVCEKYGLTREELDEFSANSQQKCEKAIAEGKFDDEIVPVPVKVKKETVMFAKDEGPRPGTTAESLSKLKCCSGKEGGLVTAGNASGINDGAAAIVVMSEEKAKELGVKPMATWVAGALGGVEPEIMGVGPVASTRKVLERTGLTIDDMDLIEANEAFAAQSVAVARDLKFDMSKVNVNGGAIALGHPVGASGCRILVTLLHEMQKRDAKRGLATLCIGGGMGCSTIVERD